MLMKIDTELLVGLFLLAVFCMLGYFSMQMGKVQFGSNGYNIYADFSTAGGLQEGALVELAGVEIGRVEAIQLAEYKARVTFTIDGTISLQEDAQAAIKTKGLIGERYVEITPGLSQTTLPSLGKIGNTQDPIDIQELIGEFIFGGIGGRDNSERAEPATNQKDTRSDVWSLGLD